MKIDLRCASSMGRQGDANGFGRVYYSLLENIPSTGNIITTVDPDIQVCLSLPFLEWDYYPWYGRHRRGKKRIIYVVWETTKLPYHWTEQINKFDAAFTPSTWCKGILEDCGVSVPIYVVPHGVNTDVFKYKERTFDLESSIDIDGNGLWPGKKFVFLWQGMHPQDRKGREYAEQAFLALDFSNAWLIEKWYPVVSNEHFGPWRIDSKHITMLGERMPIKDYTALLSKCHVSVNPYRGEAFGMLPLETASTGMPTLATGWSGPMDYLSGDGFNIINHKLCEPGDDYISTSSFNDVKQPPAQDAIPDINHIKELMAQLYENRGYCQELGSIGRDIALEWTWKKATQEFVSACEKVLDN